MTLLAHIYTLNNIKAKTVGDGQHGTARWASKAEIKRTYQHIPFTPERWRKQVKNGKTPTAEDGKELPQGIVVGCTGNTTAMIDTGDVHALMIGAAGVRIYEYTPGFIHAKNFVCDDKFAVCGTINMDYRSLVHHFECGAWMYGTECIADMKEDFLNTLAVSEKVTEEKAKLHLWERLPAELMKVFTPLL